MAADAIARDCHRLSFMLPASLVLRAPVGRHQPCIHGVVLRVDCGGLVEMEGPSRQSLFDQATRFLRLLAKGRPALTITAVLWTPGERGYPGGRDGWTITVYAYVSFAPTASGVDIPSGSAA